MSYKYNDREDMFIQFARNPFGSNTNNYWNRITYFQEGCTQQGYSAMVNGSGYVFSNYVGEDIIADRQYLQNFAIDANYSLAHSQPPTVKKTYCVMKPSGWSNFGSMISFTQFNGNRVFLTPTSNAATNSYQGGNDQSWNQKGVGFYT